MFPSIIYLNAYHVVSIRRRKSLSHDIEVQKLYEEMEQQIKNEKAKVRELVSFVSLSCDRRKQQI